MDCPRGAREADGPSFDGLLSADQPRETPASRMERDDRERLGPRLRKPETMAIGGQGPLNEGEGELVVEDHAVHPGERVVGEDAGETVVVPAEARDRLEVDGGDCRRAVCAPPYRGTSARAVRDGSLPANHQSPATARGPLVWEPSRFIGRALTVSSPGGSPSPRQRRHRLVSPALHRETKPPADHRGLSPSLSRRAPEI